MKLTRLTGILKEQKKSLEQELLLDDELVSWLQMTSDSIKHTARYILIKDTNRFGQKTVSNPWDFRHSTETRQSFGNGSGTLGLSSPWKDPFFTSRKPQKPTSNRGTNLSSQSAVKEPGNGHHSNTDRPILDRVAMLEARRGSNRPTNRLDISNSAADYRNRNSSQNSAIEAANQKGATRDGSNSYLTPHEQQVLSKYTGAGTNIYKYVAMKSEDVLKVPPSNSLLEPRPNGSQYYLMSRHRPINSLGASQVGKELGSIPESNLSGARMNRPGFFPRNPHTNSQDSTDRVKAILDDSDKLDASKEQEARVEIAGNLGTQLPHHLTAKKRNGSSRTEKLDVPASVSRALDWKRLNTRPPKVNMSVDLPAAGSGTQGTEVDISPLLEDILEPPQPTNTGLTVKEHSKLQSSSGKPLMTERTLERVNQFLRPSLFTNTESNAGNRVVNFNRALGGQTQIGPLYPQLLMMGNTEHKDQSGTGGSQVNSAHKTKVVPSSLPTSNRHLNPESKSALKLSKSILYLTMSKGSGSGSDSKKLIEGSLNSQEENKKKAQKNQIQAFPAKIQTLTIAEVEVDPSEPSEVYNFQVQPSTSVITSEKPNLSQTHRLPEYSQSKAEGTAQFAEDVATHRSRDSLEKFRQEFIDPNHLGVHLRPTSSQAILNRGMTFSDVSMQAKSQKSSQHSPTKSPTRDRFFFQPVNKLTPEQE